MLQKYSVLRAGELGACNAVVLLLVSTGDDPEKAAGAGKYTPTARVATACLGAEERGAFATLSEGSRDHWPQRSRRRGDYAEAKWDVLAAGRLRAQQGGLRFSRRPAQ